MSIWTANSNMPKFKVLDRDIDTDILIIGGGLAGVLCAYTLDLAGIDYVLLEKDRICNKTTANTTAKITLQHGLIYSKIQKEFGLDYAKLYYDANKEALGEYKRLCKNINCDYTPADSYIYSLADDALLKKEYDILSILGKDAVYTKSTELPFSVTGAVGVKNQASFNPLKFVSHIAKNLKIYENSKVVELIGNTAKTEKYRVNAKKIIVATHFPFINKHGFYFLKEYQERSYVLALEGGGELSDMYLDEADTGFSFRGYGNYILLGGGSHRTGKGECGFEKLKKAAKRFYPKAEIKYKWATQDCITLDGIPYIGRYSRTTQNLYVASGFNKWGMSSSMVGAKLLFDMVLGKESKYEKLFSPSRSIIRKQLATNTYEAICGWLTFGKKRCPHLGCALNYNKFEHSWDCSCHGSRFDERGKLLDNPANDDLIL